MRAKKLRCLRGVTSPANESAEGEALDEYGKDDDGVGGGEEEEPLLFDCSARECLTRQWQGDSFSGLRGLPGGVEDFGDGDVGFQ